MSKFDPIEWLGAKEDTKEAPVDVEVYYDNGANTYTVRSLRTGEKVTYPAETWFESQYGIAPPMSLGTTAGAINPATSVSPIYSSGTTATIFGFTHEELLHLKQCLDRYGINISGLLELARMNREFLKSEVSHQLKEKGYVE